MFGTLRLTVLTPTDQRQHHAAGDVSDEDDDQRRDYGERDAPLRIRRLLAGGGDYVETDEGVEARRRAGEHLMEMRDRSSVIESYGVSRSTTLLPTPSRRGLAEGVRSI